MIYLKLLLRSWRLIGVAILFSVIGWQHIRNLNAELEIAELRNRSQLETVARESAVREVKSRSDWTIKEINRERAQLVVAAEKNAFANFKRRYPDFDRGALGGGICGAPVLGVRIPAASTGSLPADSAKGPNAATEGTLAPNSELLERFATDCALDALAITQWQKWAVGNGLPVEK